MTTIIMILLTGLLSGCGSGGGSPAAQLNSDPASSPAFNGGTGATAQNVTLFQKSFTEAPVSGWPLKTYTSKGYCAQVNAKTYCWDDGVKMMQWTSSSVTYGPFTYSYFGVMPNPVNGSPMSCHGGCSGDYVFTPVIPDIGLTNVVGTAIGDMLAHGAQSTVSCNIVGHDLDCGTFTLVGAQ